MNSSNCFLKYEHLGDNIHSKYDMFFVLCLHSIFCEEPCVVSVQHSAINVRPCAKIKIQGLKLVKSEHQDMVEL